MRCRILVLTRKPIPVEEAVQKLAAVSKQLSNETIHLEDSFGRVLANDLYATHPIPSYTRSPYDGYAIPSMSTSKAEKGHSVFLEIVGTVGRENEWSGTIKEGQAVKVMTGSPLPNGADSVIMTERAKVVEKPGEKYIEIRRPVSKGENVSQIGEDIKENQLLVKKGTVLNPGIIASLATFGYNNITVTRKPKVGIIAAGNNLSNLEEPLQFGKVRNSNTYMLIAQCNRCRMDPHNYGQIGNQLDNAIEKIRNVLNETDVVITTGGISVGDDDDMPRIYKELGAKVLFNKIAMRPGSITSAAVIHNKLLIGLSGNPAACYVGFELFARPVIKMMLGQSKPFIKRTQAILHKDFPKPSPVTRFVRGKISFCDGKIYVEPSGKDKSNMVSSLLESNSFIVLQAGTKGYSAGSLVDVLLLEDKEGNETWL
ncbi:molybdopterin molybdenumtransferase MoeA [Terrilactibacillus sp. BCM23-1]|uniref:Molybdopterin molybdenumtransferase n=1 Tax=Terrilactibacillus tamarindi TaxID=2599694 RepID=A0A6N8CQ81_9BACI|nr:molybdopterin molybdenumtransferase MoeA [Terrilactibacillus tamarindi]